MRAHFGLPSVSNEEDKKDKPPITVKFEIPYFTVSGIQVSASRRHACTHTPRSQPSFRSHHTTPAAPFPPTQVRYLKIIEKSGYQALPWVRYITQNGDYQLRTT